jgi:hypothetical protein
LLCVDIHCAPVADLMRYETKPNDPFTWER